MSGFSRSLKSSSYLSTPYRRPPMPGRTISNSSDRSMTSDDSIDRMPSGRSTPTPAYQTRRYGPQTHPSGNSAIGGSPESAPTGREVPSRANSSSRPISIELPRVSKINSAPVYTPPEPLSARGDLPGGYFPMHEDPKARIHRPHPFHNETRASKYPTAGDTDGLPRERRTISHPPTGSTMGTSNIPVASYLPTDYHDSPMPMGKYYPSNYESTRSQGSRPTSTSPTTPGDARSPASPSQTAAPEPEIHRKLQLQQYQREMMAQASRAANEVLGTSEHNKANSPKHGGRGLMGFPGMDVRFNAQTLHKPNSPRLHPLGSPGPVTPMELESSGSGYLDKGKDVERRPGQGLSPRPPPAKGFTAHSM